MDVYISYEFVGLLSSTSAVNAVSCVQKISISTRVYSSVFSRGQHVCASLLLARGQHCCAGQRGRLYARLCHTFLVNIHELCTQIQCPVVQTSSDTPVEVIFY